MTNKKIIKRPAQGSEPSPRPMPTQVLLSSPGAFAVIRQAARGRSVQPETGPSHECAPLGQLQRALQ